MSKHPFECVLSVPVVDIEIELNGIPYVPWANFHLNPRRLRGSDFLMRWSQGVWSEQRLIDAVNASSRFFAIAYGPSGVAPANDVRAFELYFERLEAAGLGHIKRPDLLIFDSSDRSEVTSMVADFGGEQDLPFISEDALAELLQKAIVAVECENSLWIAGKMPDYGAELKPMRRLGGRLGLRKNAVLPTVIMKEEDRERLISWQDANRVPVHIWHVFFDRAYGLALSEAQQLIDTGAIEPTVQTYQAPGGATTEKSIYKFYYHYAYELGTSSAPPELVPDYVEDKNGHILPYVRFQGGSLTLTDKALEQLERLRPDET